MPGTCVAPVGFYQQQLPGFTYCPPRPHDQVLALMDACDVLVMPSIVEGRALVMQEGMSRGLPLITTANSGGQDLIDEGETGFLVPIRSPEALASKIAWLVEHRDRVVPMGQAAARKAAAITWEGYADAIRGAIAHA